LRTHTNNEIRLTREELRANKAEQGEQNDEFSNRIEENKTNIA